MSIDSNLLNWLLTYEYLAFEMLNILNFNRLAEDSNYLIANNTFNFYVSCEEFKNEIRNLINNPSEIIRIGKNALRLVKDKYDNKKIVADTIDFYNKL
jgi:glycosyltransferase involved in cell wall biosynthesis